jgi:hypothetical protein
MQSRLHRYYSLVAKPSGHSILPPRRALGSLQIAVLVHIDQVTFETLQSCKINSTYVVHMNPTTYNLFGVHK